MSASATADAELRRDVIAIAAAAIAAADPGKLVARELRCLPDGAQIAGSRYELRPGSLRILAAGKAAARMAHAAVDRLAPLEPTGLVIVPPGAGQGPARLETLLAEHPIPGAGSAEAARRAGRLLDEAGEGDLVLMLLSGGGSSLLADIPEGIDPRAYRAAIELCLRAGVAVGELNALRRQLGTLKGGRAVLRARPARVAALLMSDVVDSDPASIASGLTRGVSAKEPAAIEAVRRSGVLDRLPATIREALEAPEAFGGSVAPRAQDPRLAGTVERIVGDNGTAIAGAEAWAERCGYAVRRLRRPVVGEARAAGARLGRLGRRLAASGRLVRPVCLLAGGETVVRVTGTGVGGRNQELAAAAGRVLDGLEAVCLCSLGTDGVDGPTPAAGALVTGSTRRRAAAAGLDLDDALADNDTFRLFEALDDLLTTGPTGTNVMDVQILLLGAR